MLYNPVTGWIFGFSYFFFLLRSCEKRTFQPPDVLFITLSLNSRAVNVASELMRRRPSSQLWNDPACGNILLGWFFFFSNIAKVLSGWLWFPLISILHTDGLCHRSPLELDGQLCVRFFQEQSEWAKKKHFPQEPGNDQTVWCKNMVTVSWEKRRQTAVSCSGVHPGWMI